MLNGKDQERDDILRKLSRIVEAHVDFERGIDVDLSHFDLPSSLADYRRDHDLSDKADGCGVGSRAADPLDTQDLLEIFEEIKQYYDPEDDRITAIHEKIEWLLR